jgi:hypothetical protein
MNALLHRLVDLCLLLVGTVLFGGSLTAVFQTGHYGFVIPDIPYLYTATDFWVTVVIASLSALLLLVLLERMHWIRRSFVGRATVFAVAACAAMIIGAPAAVLFGNTWTNSEIIITYLLVQPEVMLLITVILVLIRCLVMHRLFKPGLMP